LTGILWLALALRLAPWGDNRFLEDEALYATWGLQIAAGADPMLDEEPVDKPPLHAYTLALSFLALGQNETAARLPSLLASVASIALVYAVGRALYGDPRVGLLAALLLALSPFDILFASTAFTDPLMTAWVLAALWAAVTGRPGTAGLLAGLAACTKQQGLFFLPLVGAVSWGRARVPATGKPKPEGAGLARAGWLRFALGFGLIAAGTIAWDLARVQRPGFLAQSLISYGGLGPAQPLALGERALSWLGLVGDFWVSPWFNGLLVGGLLVWLAGGFRGWWPGWSAIDGMLIGFVACFLLLHWLVGFQVWDRYLLGLVSLVALLAARAAAAPLRAGPAAVPWRRAYTAGLGVVLALSLAGPVWQATRSGLPLGGDHGAYDGIEDLAGYLRTHASPGSVLYHHWLGYHYRFYLYGAPLRLHWYPDLADLVQDATIYRREPRYIAFPSWRDGGPAEAALAGSGIGLVPVLVTSRRDGTPSFRLYHLEGPEGHPTSGAERRPHLLAEGSWARY
jgi:4-amino-4-deoxy-L-arabinose transferase-like glycosyltransferase